MTDVTTRITAIVGESYAAYEAAHRALREANLSSYALRLLADFTAHPQERSRALTAAACAFASMPAHTQMLLAGQRKDSTLAGLIARGTTFAHAGQWPVALRIFEEAHARRLEAEPAYSLAISLHAARYAMYYGAYADAAHYLFDAAKEVTTALPQWQCLIALSRSELSARRGELEKANLHLNETATMSAHLQPHAALARATLSEARSDGARGVATVRDVEAALDSAQSPVAASILHFITSTRDREFDQHERHMFERTLNVVSNDLAAQPFLSTAAARCGPLYSRLALDRLDALAAHAEGCAPHAFATLTHADVAFTAGRRDEAFRKAEQAARHFEAIGDALYARKALELLVDERRGSRAQTTDTRLTKRQAEIVALVRRGLTNKQLAVELHISEHTVERHLTAIFTKLKLRSRYQLSQ